jgi:quercetin dioxygenase-like cupin family protein
MAQGGRPSGGAGRASVLEFQLATQGAAQAPGRRNLASSSEESAGRRCGRSAGGPHLGFCQVDARAPSRTLEMFVASVRTEICFKCNHVRLGRNAFVTRGSEYWSHATVNDRAPPASFLPAVQRKRSLTMPDNLNHDTRRAMSATNAMEVFSPQKQVRPMNERLTEFSDNEADFCVMRCTLPAGAVVPMHSHADRETFYLLSGELDALMGDRWEVLRPGDVFDVRGGQARLEKFVASGGLNHLRDNDKAGPVSGRDIDSSRRLASRRARSALPQTCQFTRVLAGKCGRECSGRTGRQLGRGSRLTAAR